MWLKLLLGTFFVLSLVGAFVVEPASNHELKRESNPDSRAENNNRLRLLTWNIGNGDLESETRAHAEDLPAVAKVILDNDADAVARFPQWIARSTDLPDTGSQQSEL